MNGAFTCPTRLSAGLLEITPSGDLDLNALPQLDAVLSRVADADAGVQLDLSSVPFMDSSALGFLAALQRDCRLRGLRLLIAGLRPQHHRLLELTAFDLVALG
jgi:anti-anti-sigma factor